jgi:CheY-like chemotaxis protein
VKKKIELVTLPDPALPALVSGDPVRLRQILFNLTGNAIKFTDRGQVTVKATHEPDANGRIPILIEVSDTGIGIAASDLKKIFEEFEQGTGIVNQKRGGAGLGLAITRGLVELHGGRLSVESKPGKGSVFSARLFYAPAKGTAVTAVPAAVGKEHALAGLRVLVVDDEAFNRRLIKAVLGKYGCEVAEAGSGEEALEWIREHTADVILMDLRLPGMSGAGAAREIRRITEKTGTRIPVIAVSADVASSPDGGYTENGFDGGIPKPFEEEQLFKAIHAVIRQKDYDLKPLREASGGDPVFLNEMIRLFIDNTAKGLVEVQIYLTEQRPVEAADILHRISPPCHHLKAEHLYSLLKKAEQSLRAGRMTDPVNEMIHQARKEFDRIADDLKNQIEP